MLNQGSLLIKERVVSVFSYLIIYGLIVNGKTYSRIISIQKLICILNLSNNKLAYSLLLFLCQKRQLQCQREDRKPLSRRKYNLTEENYESIKNN